MASVMVSREDVLEEVTFDLRPERDKRSWFWTDQGQRMCKGPEADRSIYLSERKLM